MLSVVLSRFRYEFKHSFLRVAKRCLLCGCFFCLVLQEDKDSSSSSKDDDDDGGDFVEGVPIAVNEATVSEAAAADSTAAAEPADSVTAASKSASGTADVSDVPKGGVDVPEMIIEGAVEAPEGVVSAGIVDDVGLTQGGPSRSSDRVNSALLDSTPLF